MATDDKFNHLSTGSLRVTGRLVDASNATLYAVAELDGAAMVCIYKPIAGERPLWDFPDGCLAHREFAAYIVSEQLGFNVVPLTVLRDGPYGQGMAQEWIDIDESIDLAQFFSTDHPRLRAMALFDAIVNNTYRKIGHLLPVNNKVVYGCDHGVTFHTEDKLRTVLQSYPNVAAMIKLTAKERYSTYVKQQENDIGVEFGEELASGITRESLQTVSGDKYRNEI